jgi:hypothetical protein
MEHNFSQREYDSYIALELADTGMDIDTIFRATGKFDQSVVDITQKRSKTLPSTYLKKYKEKK